MLSNESLNPVMIPFTKLAGSGNDFILILSEDFPDTGAKESLIQQ